VLFEKRLQRGLVDGSISVAFRRWRRPQVVPGRRYRSPIGLVEVDAVELVDGQISLDDAHAAGYPSVETLLADLKGPPDSALYRLELRTSPEADPRQELAATDALGDAERRDLTARLARLDGARPWTLATLQTIQQHPGTRAGDLYADLGWPDLATFKLHVRKLKALGLTISLLVGYRLSARGEAYLRGVTSADA
jgi:hypothetical protein